MGMRDSGALSPEQCRAARAQLGWTQKQLGTAAGIAERTVINFENGHTYERKTALAIKAVLVGEGVHIIENDGVEGVLWQRHLVPEAA